MFLSEETQKRIEEQISRLAQSGITEGVFRETVQANINEGGLSFILAVYKAFDEFFEKEMKIFGVTLACGKGCSKCCYTLITSTEGEINEVIRFINSLPRTVRMPLIKKAIGLAREWRDYYRENESSIRINPFKAFNDWQGKPCPFLNEDDGSCSVYPVRIVDCRTLTSLTACVFPKTRIIFFAGPHAEGAIRYRFQCEAWASNLIMEEIQRKLGLSNPTLSPVTPVPHWLYMKRKEIG